MVTPLNTLKNWYKTRLMPTQSQFWAWLDSYWHKDEYIPSSKIGGLQEMLDLKVDKKDTIAPDQVGPYDPEVDYVYDALLAEYVSFSNPASADPQFQVEGFYRLKEDAPAGENPETHPAHWVYQGTVLGEITIEDVVGLIERLYDIERSNYWTLTSQQALFPSNDISLTNSSVKHVSVSEVTIIESDTDFCLFSGNILISEGLTFDEYLYFLKSLPDWTYNPEYNVCFYEGSEYISVTTNTGTYLAYLGAIGFMEGDPVIQINFDDPIPEFTQIEYDHAILRKVKLTGLPSEPSVDDEAVSAEYVNSLSVKLFGSLSNVARSGDYNDLLNKPSIPKMPKEFLIPGSMALKNYLYNWYALQYLSSGNDWRVPTSEDFQTLSAYLGANGGTKLHSDLSVNEYPFTWNTPGTNDYSFSLFPLGFASTNNFDTSKAAHFWTSYNSSTAYGGHYVIFSTGEISYISVSKTSGIGVRLCKDYSGDYEEGILIHDAYRGNDGKLYPAVRIGNKLWLAENLSETKYNDDTEITFSSDFTEWAAVGTSRGAIKHSFQEQAGFIPSHDFKEKPGLRFIQEKINIKAGDEDYELSVLEGGLAVKNKTRGDGSNRLLQYVFLSGPLIDGAPSAAEINSIITAAGYNISDIQSYFILDSDGSGLLYHVISNGTKFYYTTFNEASIIS